MTLLSINISDDLEKLMKQFPNIKWDAFINKMIAEYLKNLIELDNIAQVSELTEKDAWELGELIKTTAWESFKDKYMK